MTHNPTNTRYLQSTYSKMFFWGLFVLFNKFSWFNEISDRKYFRCCLKALDKHRSYNHIYRTDDSLVVLVCLQVTQSRRSVGGGTAFSWTTAVRSWQDAGSGTCCGWTECGARTWVVDSPVRPPTALSSHPSLPPSPSTSTVRYDSTIATNLNFFCKIQTDQIQLRKLSVFTHVGYEFELSTNYCLEL